MSRTLPIRLALCVCWAVLAWLGAAAPAASEDDPKPVYETPIYNAEAKSYFELVPIKASDRWLSQRREPEVRWAVAESLAAQRTYKGVKGRLAVVHDLAVHQFLIEKFRPREPAWIGAAYYCKERELKWSVGHSQHRGEFQAWDRQWDQSGPAGCVHSRGEGNYMPIAYTGAPDGFRWVAKGAKKEYTAYFVEYPTGKP